jgi:hypothetical protein
MEEPTFAGKRFDEKGKPEGSLPAFRPDIAVVGFMATPKKRTIVQNMLKAAIHCEENLTFFSTCLKLSATPGTNPGGLRIATLSEQATKARGAGRRQVFVAFFCSPADLPGREV